MAVHAGARGRKVRDARDLDRGVTVAAIETKLADVELVAVRDGLNGTVAHVCVPRGKTVPDARDDEHRTDGARNRGHDREFVPPRGEDLGQRLRLRGAGEQLPRPRVRDETVMPHPRNPKEFAGGNDRSACRLTRNLIHELGEGSSAPRHSHEDDRVRTPVLRAGPRMGAEPSIQIGPTPRGRQGSLVHSADSAPDAFHAAVEVTHDCVRLAALEVVDMHVGRPVRLLPGEQQQMWLEMRDRYAGEISRIRRTHEGSSSWTLSPTARVSSFHRDVSRTSGQAWDREASRRLAPPGAAPANAMTICRRTRWIPRRGCPACPLRPHACRVPSRAP